ncbi:MDR family MFS transporter [Chromobacterium sp. IIBBL 290-4]|uniref:MDR family MFS transporter n=1 Tax=Chromobacterium sp. IIBBL 290-4 TaxID=2953890 RepID=UPI0020B6CE41|nr:MDR family MFS transporter [Chromobacterium sp. IIBBL 290-4]UTH75859.1 MFS transporter [Chromobacterium sp. IIBBL 290-4]
MNAPVSSPALALDFRQRLLAMLGLCCVLIMVALDQTVVGTAMPTVVADLRGFALYAWVGTSYLLTSVITVPIFGKLGDDHGRKPFVLTAIVVFTAASMLCGLAQNMPQLVLARALQGVGGGMLVATTFACVPDLFPHTRERLRWQVMLSASFGLANAVGPSLGGFLTEYFGWRWVFFVNLPVGVISLFAVWRFLPVIRHPRDRSGGLDWQGAALIALFLGSLQLLVEWLPQHGSAGELTLLGGVAAVSLAALVWWERRSANPLLPPSLLAQPGLAPLFGLSMLMGFGLFAVMYYAPLMFQAGFGLSPNQAGVLVTPLVVCITIGSMLNGRIVQRLKHPTRLLTLGLVLFAMTAALLTQATRETAHALIIANMVFGGLGLGLLMPNLTIFVQQLSPRHQLGVATAMLQSTRMVGGMLGTAIMGTVVSHHFREGVAIRLAAAEQTHWLGWLADPQTLLNAELLARFRHLAAAAQPEQLLAWARLSLVDAIHFSQAVVAICLLLGWWLVRKVPPIQLSSAVANSEDQHG